MSPSRHRQPRPADNPFQRYGNPYASRRPHALPASQSSAAGASRKPGSYQSKPMQTARPSAARKRKPAPLQILFRLCRPGFGLLVGFFLVFCLLPGATQHQIYSLLGIKKTTTVERVLPLPLHYHYISSPFGKRWGRLHQGIDFAAVSGTPIRATAAGTIAYSGWEPGYGKSVVIDHGNGLQTRYAHCSRLIASVGKAVAKGELIARVGSTGHSTGPHLHFEVILNGERRNPAWYYNFESTQPRVNQQLAQAR